MRYATVLQSHWDWRAAANFMFGGAGGALLFVGAIATLGQTAQQTVTVLALAMMAFGLTMVWLEIGRPLRAANVMLKPQNSWMTREAYVAALAFVLAAGSMLLRSHWLALSAGVTGIAFLYCQSRILLASKGIPAWRVPAVVGLIVTTGLTEATGTLALVVIILTGPTGHLPIVLALLIVIRLMAWRLYCRRLMATDPPRPVAAEIDQLNARIVIAGHLLPLALIASGFALSLPGWLGQGIPAGVAVLAGWQLKFSLVTRLACVEGYGLGAVKRGHPLKQLGITSVSEMSVRLRRTREAAPENRGRTAL